MLHGDAPTKDVTHALHDASCRLGLFLPDGFQYLHDIGHLNDAHVHVANDWEGIGLEAVFPLFLAFAAAFPLDRLGLDAGGGSLLERHTAGGLALLCEPTLASFSGRVNALCALKVQVIDQLACLLEADARQRTQTNLVGALLQLASVVAV